MIMTLEMSTNFSWKVIHTPFKRIFDILFSAAILFLISPLFIAIAAAIALTSRGPIFYSQERVGRGGFTFRCYKFRSMYTDAEQRLAAVLECDPEKRHEWEISHKLKNDPRATPIGKLLRRSSLDELPQFWNVIRGDLSVVGPRPVVKEEILKHFGNKAQTIFAVRPGITGLWQVSGRSNTTYKNRIALDESYVNARSAIKDLMIIAWTIPSLITRKGAY
jgi:undecaprenyl-phosphate galactose phosphotransferase